MSLESTHNKWTDGDLTLELELKLKVNFQELRGKLYSQVFLEGDEKGECNIAPFLCKDDRDFIECNIVDKMEENDE